MQLASGTANAGDTFTVNEVAMSDTAGILPALGINSFFSGNRAATIAVQPNLLADPSQFAASLTGQPATARTCKTWPPSSTRRSWLTARKPSIKPSPRWSATLARASKALLSRQSNQQLVGQSLQTQQQSVSGVESLTRELHPACSVPAVVPAGRSLHRRAGSDHSFLVANHVIREIAS